VELDDQKQQRRYSPKIRRGMILDKAAEIINEEGISNLTMERISRNADISKSLMYKYFDSLTDLLKELLDRELSALRNLQFKAAERAVTFEDLVSNITHEYLTYIHSRGLIIERLQAEPSVTGLHDPTDFGRSAAVKYLAPIVSKTFHIPIELAEATTDISFGLPSAAGHFLLRGHMTVSEVEKLTTKMIIGTLNVVRDEYFVREKELVR